LNPKNTISEEIIINRNIDWLFAYSQDFTERKKWDKQTIEISFFDGFTELKKGAKVYTKSAEGIRMDTEYLIFDPPNTITIQMLNTSWLFKNFLGTWNYITIENDKTILRITYQFDLRFPYYLFTGFVIRKIRKNMTNKLNALKDYLSEMEHKNQL